MKTSVKFLSAWFVVPQPASKGHEMWRREALDWEMI